MNKLLTWVDIRPNEGKLVAWMLLFAFLAETINTIIYTVAYALFLNEFDAQSLPYIYIGASLVTTLATIIFLRLSQRYSLSQLGLIQLSFILLTLLGYRTGLIVVTNRWFLFTLPIWHGLVNTILYTMFWSLLGRLFNLQQGKRLFSLLGAGQEITALVIGFLIPGFVILLGTANLLWVAATVAVGLCALLFHMARQSPILSKAVVETAEMASEEPAPANNFLTDPYVHLICAMYFVFALSDYFVDNIFYTQVESQITNPDQLASFLGIFTAVVAGLSLCSQLFLSNWLLRRYGVRIAILLTPILLFVGIFIFALTGTIAHSTLALFWLTISVNLARYTTNALDNTASNLLYQPLPGETRTRFQTIIDGIIYPVASGITGLLLLWLTNGLHFTSIGLAYVLLPILVIWVLLAAGLGRLYPKRVQQALHQRLLSGNSITQLDRASLESIRQNLANPHPGAVIYGLNVLEALDTEELARALPLLLKHPSAPVRLDVLTRLERLGSTTALPTIDLVFHTDPDPAVRIAALRAIAMLGGIAYFEEIDDYLTVPDRELRQGAMIGLLRNGELESILAVGGSLTGLISSAHAPDRCLAAQVLGESGLTSFYRPLLKLLDDPDPQVQRAALEAAGKLQQPKLWPVVCALLATFQTRSAAQAALVAGGGAVLPALKTALAEVGEDLQWRIALVRTAGRIRGTQAAEILLPQLEFPDHSVHVQTLLALQQSGYQAAVADRPLIEMQIGAELLHVAWTLAGLVDLADEPASALLYTALERSLVQQRARLFLLLSFIYDPVTVRRVRDALGVLQGSHRQAVWLPAYNQATPRADMQENRAEQRAYAMETLDVLVDKAISRNLLPLFDDLSPAQQLKQLANNFPQPALNPSARVQAIITGPDAWVSPWLKSMAIYTMTTQLLTVSSLDPSDSTTLYATVAAPSPTSVALVQETASWALARLEPQQPSHPDPSSNQPLQPLYTGVNGMLLTIEKVIILNTIDIFAQTPDEILVDIAALLKEMTVPAGATIFEKGEQGESMYIIVEGEVEARDGERVFARMGERQVFGEMALLDGEPRTATIRTTQATRLLRLDQEPFYELMDDQIEIARGVIRVLLHRLRARTNDVNQLREQLEMA